MIKLFVTGDNHFGRQYAKSPIKDILIQSRYDSLEQMIRTAEIEECNYFIITGDLFDRINGITKREIDKVVSILEQFNQTVLVMPGNHDFFTGGEKLWKDFQNRASQSENIVLLNEYRVFKFDDGENELIVYPAYCDSKHSTTNRLKWIEEVCDSEDCFSIGIAHGTLRGISPDMKEEYFPMDLTELDAIPVDAWLIGHTHITYPFDLPYNKDLKGYKIFNAGTHEQLDSGNNTEGNAFILTLEREAGIKTVFVRKIHTGNVAYKNIKYTVEHGDNRALSEIVSELTKNLSKRTVVNLDIEGTISEEDFENREEIFKWILGQYLNYSITDEYLVPAITLDKIRDNFSELSLAAQFLEGLLDDPMEVQMAYDLLQKCNNAG